MAQILRLSSIRKMSLFLQIPETLINQELVACRSCQRLQQSSTARVPRRGFNILYRRRSSSTKIAEHQKEERLKNSIDQNHQQTNTELSKVLQARMTQLQSAPDTRYEAETMNPRSSSSTVSEDSWKVNLANFGEQMAKHREGYAEVEGPQISGEQISQFLHQSEQNVKFNKTEEPEDVKSETKTKTKKSTDKKRTKSKTPKQESNTSNKPKKSSKSKKGSKSKTPAAIIDLELVNPDGMSRPLSGTAVDLDPCEDVEPDTGVDMVREIERVLQDQQTDQQVAQQLQGYLQKLIDSEKLAPESLTSPFWKPEELKNMTEVKYGLEVVEKLSQKMTQLQVRAVERELERQAQRRNQAYNQEVRAYVDACLHAGLLRKAHAALVVKELNKKSSYRSRRDSAEFTITDVEVYNKVLAAWAKQGDLERIKRLFRQMVGNQVTPTLQSYAASLECLGRAEPVNVDMVHRILEDINAAGLDLQNILNECYFHKDEWSCVEKAIGAAQPDFTPRVTMSADQYACDLLSQLNDHSTSKQVANPHHGLMDSEQLKARANRQLTYEQTDFVTVGTILPRNDHLPKVQEARKKLEESKLLWKESLRNAFKRDLMIEEKRKYNVGGMSVVPYLKLFPQNTYVNLMMQEIETLALETESYSPSLSLLQRQFGSRVNRHFMVKDRIRSGYVTKLSEAYKEYVDDYLSEQRSQPTDRQCWQALLNEHTGGVRLDTRPKLWPSPATRSVGRWLYRLILMDIKIDANLFKDTTERKEIPAFYTVYRQEGPLVKEVIKPHPLLVRLFRTASVQSLMFDTSAMPSLTPPLPWHSVSGGGNLLSTTNLVINPQRSQEQVTSLRHLPENQLNPLYDALNVLSATPWKINQPILDLVVSIFNEGGSTALDIPLPASSFPDPPKIHPGMSDEDKVAILRERQRLKKEQQEMHSLWMTELYRFSIANHYRNEIFWFPHNLDFRSRVYATPPHFNHLGSDLARSILLFAEGKKLGPHGLDWLKIHLINLTGFKKRSSNAERLAYANEVMSEVLDSADNPMTGRRWWQTSDEPWQTLACCMELAKAVRCPQPEDHVCYFPVHQDGSCNGLQHYAALGRDQAGAQSVNLHPFTSPKDVYSDVVDLVEEERAKDAAAGEEIAIALEGFIRRKVIKQTIMTTVYGVTRFGARLQIEGQLKDIEDFPDRRVFDASLYLTRKTFDCLQKMFTSTKEIQDWFTVCAKITSSIFYKPMEWETPLGWPVIQPYYRTYNPATLLNRPKVGHIEIANTKRQKNGFPPNFIHSLDSTHMMLTAICCQRAGVSFVSVHDCFWTHPADVPTMNKICREQFVALHSQPILEDLADFMYNKYGYLPGDEEYDKVDPITRDFINHVLQRVPERGTFDLNKVLTSTYFFS